MRLRDRVSDPGAPPGRPRWPDWGWVALFWLLLGTIAVVNAYVNQRLAADSSRGAGAFLTLASHHLPPYLLWALFTPGIFRAARRFGLRSDSWIRTGLVHVGGAAVMTVTVGAARAWIHDLLVHGLNDGHAWKNLFAGGLLRGYELDLFVYGAVLGGVWALDAYGEARERRRHEAQLREELGQARYQALRMQIQPHFLFNTLNTVSALVERDPDASRRVVARLSDLLRRVLEDGQEQETPLDEELSFVRSYLEIEQIRYGERLEVEIRAEPGLETCLVPTLVLQPLVENGIRHGIARTPWKGKITVEATRREGGLVLTVIDTGPGPDPASPARGAGLALDNTRRRLEELYGAGARLDLDRAPSGGCRAQILIPRRHRAGQPKGSLLADAG